MLKRKNTSVTLSYENEEEFIDFDIETKLTAKDAKKGSCYILSTEISALCSNIDTYREKVIESTERLFNQLLKSLQELHAEIVLISDFAALL